MVRVKGHLPAGPSRPQPQGAPGPLQAKAPASISDVTLPCSSVEQLTALPGQTGVATATQASSTSNGSNANIAKLMSTAQHSTAGAQQDAAWPPQSLPQLYKAGSPDAMRWWQGNQPRHSLQNIAASPGGAVRNEVKTAISEALKSQGVVSDQLKPLLDVWLVHRKDQQALKSLIDSLKCGKQYSPQLYNAAHLQQKHKFRMLNQSSIVVDAATMEVLLLFVTQQHLQQLHVPVADAPERQQELFDSMRACYNPEATRNNTRNLFMTGLRFCPTDTQHAQCGTYALKKKHNADKEWPQLQTRLKQCAAVVSKAEQLVAPQAAAARLAAAKTAGLPRGLGGLTVEQCPAMALGCSQAFVSPPHWDQPVCGLYECILFSADSMPKKVGWTFTSLEAGVLVDLQASPCCLVMVPGNTCHGTPWVSNTQCVRHRGIGVVITSKENMFTNPLKPAVEALFKKMEADPEFNGGVFVNEELLSHITPHNELTAEEQGAVASALLSLKRYLATRPDSQKITSELSSIMEGWQVKVVRGLGDEGSNVHLFAHPNLPAQAFASEDSVYRRCKAVVFGRKGCYVVRSVEYEATDASGRTWYRVLWEGWPAPGPLDKVSSWSEEVNNNWRTAEQVSNLNDLLPSFDAAKKDHPELVLPAATALPSGVEPWLRSLHSQLNKSRGRTMPADPNSAAPPSTHKRHAPNTAAQPKRRRAATDHSCPVAQPDSSTATLHGSADVPQPAAGQDALHPDDSGMGSSDDDNSNSKLPGPIEQGGTEAGPSHVPSHTQETGAATSAQPQQQQPHVASQATGRTSQAALRASLTPTQPQPATRVQPLTAAVLPQAGAALAQVDPVGVVSTMAVTQPIGRSVLQAHTTAAVPASVNPRAHPAAAGCKRTFIDLTTEESENIITIDLTGDNE